MIWARRLLRWLLPLILASSTVVLKGYHGQALALLLLLGAAVLLGWAIALLLESVLSLVSTARQETNREVLNRTRQQELEQIEHALQEIALDQDLQKIDEEQALLLSGPLQERAAVLRERLQWSAIQEREALQSQIEQELARRRRIRPGARK
jgi:hypothetical protein